MYDLVGEYPARTFFRIDPDTGMVHLQRSLQQDSNKRTQYTVSTAAGQQ